MNHTNWVNESRNVVWLSGYAKGGDDTHILLYQSANEDRAIPVRVNGRQRRPRPNTPCEIKCHVHGYRDEDGKFWVNLDAIQIKRASVTSTPRRLVALNALRPQEALAAKDYSPFVSLERLKSEVKDSMRIDGDIVESLLQDASRRTSMHDSFQNKVILSGFVGMKGYVPPADDGSGDLGHVRVNVMQHTDQEIALQVRVLGADGRFSKEIKSFLPLVVMAQVRTDVVKNEQGEILERRVFLATERAHVGMANVNDFEHKRFPDWWVKKVNAHYAERQRQNEQRDDQHAAKPVAAAPTPAMEVAVAAGVQESSEVF